MIRQVSCLLVVINLAASVESARILGVFSFPSISHQVVFRAITNELVKRGHDLTVVTTDPAYPEGLAPANLKEINVHNESYQAKIDSLESEPVVGNEDLILLTEICKELSTSVFETQLNVKEFQDFISNKTQQFDLIIIEPIVRPNIVVSHIFKAPVILISSLGVTFSDNNIIGISSHPILYPSIHRTKIYNLTFWEKVTAIYQYFRIEYRDIFEWQINEHKMLQKYFGPDVPSISDLYNNVDMLFLNVHPIWAENQPVPPNVIYLGGIHRKEDKDLPKDLQAHLDSSKFGVIYVSFGTNALARFIPRHVVESIVKVLSKLPYDVLWKWDEDQLPLQSKNIKLSKWFPQADLLRHKKIKLFITQAGLQSTDEAIMAGVPLLAIPMLGDQPFNADKYVRHGIGKKVPLEGFEENLFEEAVDSLLTDDSYRQNIIRFRKLILDQPEPPLERAIWWIEYVIRNGGAKHLRAPTANISWREYVELDVILFAVFVLVAVLAAVTSLLLLGLKSITHSSIFLNKKTKEN